VRTISVLIAVLVCSVVLGCSHSQSTTSPSMQGNVPSMQGDVDQAATIIERFQAVPEKGIPQAVLRDARGLGIMTVIKGAFGFSGQAGKGVVVARTRNGWSGPSAIGTGGAGFGLQIGGEVTEFVMVLNTDAAVQAFSRDVNVTLGGDISVAAGPIGRTAEAAITPIAAIYTYSRSQGLFAGISLQGAIIGARDDANAEYYGRRVTPADILSGRVPPPPGATRLVQVLTNQMYARR
jgi:lipid-binding SYLF domain-containing protein